MDQIPFGANSFSENPEPRVPCVLLLDTSYSMSGQPIDSLNDGIVGFKDELVADALASKRVEPAIITFGESVTLLSDFQTASTFVPPLLTANGSTPMGEAVHLAIDTLEIRKQSYKQHGIGYYRPWIFLITDGAPTDEWEDAASRAKAGDGTSSFAFFCVGTPEANKDILAKFTSREPLTLDGLKFRNLFLWLSSSLRSVSQSTVGEDVPLSDPTSGPTGWAKV
ncbi:vWA domain-containing protein [Aeoliella sp. SH292]|uniref:vWA domain-containing protein n=1 Tax=Aeoliella sp. SH292 TaxID=3454464 RepID=UPI003F95C8C4